MVEWGSTEATISNLCCRQNKPRRTVRDNQTEEKANSKATAVEHARAHNLTVEHTPAAI